MQFDVYRNPSRRSRDRVPYLLDVQADLLDQLGTRLIVPMVRMESFGKPARVLNPTFTIEQDRVVLSTAEIAGVPSSALGGRVASLVGEREAIVAALDLLLTGV